MRFSLNWLKELCEVDAAPDEVAQRLTAAGFEVEAVTDLRAQWTGLLVVEIAELKPHPQADKLQLVKLLDGEGTRNVVSGAPNLAVGMRVVLAEPGAVLQGKRIEVATLRGERSEGMLCSERELGLSDAHAGVLELPADWALGKRLADTPLCDVLLDIGITPNRPDAMCHLGMARELAAAFGSRMKRPRQLLREEGGDVGERIGVEVIEQTLCKRYLGRAVIGLKIAESPLLVRSRLNTLGTRAINNVVDATNWVMLELGHPLHAFDLARLQAQGKQKKVTVRRATAGETLITLDGVERKLGEDDLVIADGQRAVALAGVMGGDNSEIKDDTTDVLIETAHFESSAIYRTAKRLGLHSEASNRFWRGTDVDGLAAVNERACQLLSEWCGGKICRGAVDVYPRRRQPLEISLRPKRLQDYLGVQVSAEDVAKYLTSLELTVKGRTEQALTFGIPAFRLDLLTEVDLIEEVARRHGYQNIPERLPEAGGPYQPQQTGGQWSTLPDHRRLRELLASLGLSEAINYSFQAPKDEALFRPPLVADALALQNPMSEDESVMRTSLLPGLMRNAVRNISRQLGDVRLFEIGRTYRPRHDNENAGNARDQKLPIEEERLAILLHGPASPFGWGMPTRDVDFYDIKRVAEALFDTWGLQVRFASGVGAAGSAEGATVGSSVSEPLPAHLHPLAAATLALSGAGGTPELIGSIGQVHPRVVKAFGVEGAFFVLDIKLRPFADETRAVRYRSLPRFPGIRRDLAVVAKDEVRTGELVDYVRGEAQATAPTLEDVQLFDVYQGKPIPKGHTSLALAFFFRHHERTLTDDEVQAQFDALVRGLKARFALEVREG